MNLWLKEVPPYTLDFIKLAFIYSLIETIANPLMTGAQATGKIKWYQVIIGSFIFLTLPAIWIVLKITNNPLNVYWVLIINSIIALIFRVLFLVKMMGLNLKSFTLHVILRILLVSTLTIVVLSYLQFEKEDNLINLFYQLFLVFLVTTTIIIVFGISKNERIFMINVIKGKILKK
jgi:hypothetical protein